MRIVAGTFRGRRLVAPKGQSTRPTADRARQAIFNVLEHAAWSPGLEDLRVIDVFAGSGALGLEALSRGAAFCRFVDQGAPAREVIAQNIAALGVEGRTRIDRREATSLGARTGADGAPYDLVFLDPPFRKGLGEPAVGRLLAGDWLAADALVVLERALEDPAPTPPGLELLDERTWVAGRVSFLRRSPALA
jgi:16S rRNA (guanine966-N2)-methyltransferase